MIALQPWQLPAAALDDYAEYRRRGGRFPLGDWWHRYKDDYVTRPTSAREAAS